MERIKRYNEVLGLKNPVNADELKKLYRSKAKSIHPDLNLKPNSHDEFLLLNEAYEFYSHLLEEIRTKNKTAEQFNSKKYPGSYYRDGWKAEVRAAGRKRAAERKRMKYRQFEQKGYFRSIEKMFFLMDVMRFVAAWVLLLLLPVFLFFQMQFIGLLIAFTVQFVTYRLWYSAIKRFIPLS